MRTGMVSLPMNGLNEETIVRNYYNASKKLLHEYSCDATVDTLFNGDDYSDEALAKKYIVNPPLYFLARSLERMSECDVVYFCKGWENARGCMIEHEAAKQYGLEIIYE